VDLPLPHGLASSLSEPTWLVCSANSNHGFWSSAWPKMGRPPADPAYILREFQEQKTGWAARIAAIEPGILLGKGIRKTCGHCGAHLVPAP
jgi:hypothetical protein